MSVEASIDISFSENNREVLFSTISVLNESGWSLKDERGKILYLPVGDDDLFEWQDDLTSEEALKSIIDTKIQQNELVGIYMYWQNPRVSIALLFRMNRPLGIGLNVDRKKLNGEDHRAITDVNWYLQRILVPLRNRKLPIEAFTFSELQ